MTSPDDQNVAERKHLIGAFKFCQSRWPNLCFSIALSFYDDNVPGLRPMIIFTLFTLFPSLEIWNVPSIFLSHRILPVWYHCLIFLECRYMVFNSDTDMIA